MIDARRPEVAEEFGDDLEVTVAVFIRGDRRLKISRAGQSVRDDESEVRKAEELAEVLADVAAHIAVDFDAELDPARHDADLARRDVENAELRANDEPPLLGHDEQLAIGVVKKAIGHRAIRGVDV